MDEWKKYTGKCGNQFYDLKLKSGRVIIHCWPWKGNFNLVDGVSNTCIEGDYVDFIRVCHQQWDWDQSAIIFN
ncbi:hypothetical protein QNI19_11040 [Cytophagaceae bacterium DM2B3-1]|uniref:Uncharacterized protein n=2 Tax=Xanthocytophaga TaxID=3078918 RepID=A0AAE3QPN5_9BACT|nr:MULTISPECIES: hypothetical protein [Xanthocytophaga]MDJ1469522.1 hypothetical protein [Xanthocytophaga flavus]MDJ1480836.1 hypothetical protein [Xanthocytophaga flavus]MDJ1493468.1 hypothetical protein [Xanthocytophaga flavus]MDJ1501585.1 hypothetical protein [Xanthocytophaga agilis]